MGEPDTVSIVAGQTGPLFLLCEFQCLMVVVVGSTTTSARLLIQRLWVFRRKQDACARVRAGKARNGVNRIIE